MTRFISEPADPFALDPDFTDTVTEKTGVLLVNLGTPDRPDASSIRTYLREFLSDPRVVEIPQAIWQIILNVFVLTKRPQAIVPNYEKVWLAEGSPLLVYTQQLQTALINKFQQGNLDIELAIAMRYGNPGIQPAIDQLRAKNCSRILVMPMYPQYAASTTATAVDAVNTYLARLRKQPTVRYVDRFYDSPDYLAALQQSIQNYWAEHGKPEKLLLSFHGLPQSAVSKGDPYFRHCMNTAHLLKQYLGKDADLVHVAFQSRFGKEPWLEPSTQDVILQWGRAKTGRIDVICPGFVADCLETLEEINIACRDSFIDAGGQDFHYIPCLNAQDFWVDAMTRIILDNLHGWT